MGEGDGRGNTGSECPPHHPTRGLIERRKLSQSQKWIKVRNKPYGTTFSAFLSDGGSPNVAEPGKTFPTPALDGPGSSHESKLYTWIQVYWAYFSILALDEFL